MILFDEIRRLFHQKLDAPEVVGFLARHPGHKVGKPSDGQQYVAFLPHGFDLMFQPLTGMRGGSSQRLRVLTTVFLFPEGREKHREFPQPPFGAAFTDTHDILTARLVAAFTDSVPSLGSLCWEKWRVEDLLLYARYRPEAGTILEFVFSKAAWEDPD